MNLSKSEFYKELEKFGGKKIDEIVKDGAVNITISVSVSYYMGSFGSKDRDTCELTGWTTGNYKNVHKRIYLSDDEEKREEYERKIEGKIKELNVVLANRVMIQRDNEGQEADRFNELRKRTGAEKVEEHYGRTFKGNYVDGTSLIFGGTTVVVGSSDSVTKITFDYGSEKGLESVLKMLKVGKFSK